MFTGELSKVNPKTWKTFSKILVMEYTIEAIIRNPSRGVFFHCWYLNISTSPTSKKLFASCLWDAEIFSDLGGQKKKIL